MADSAEIDAFYLEHFGKKGMHWGVRKTKGPASEDHQRVAAIRDKVKSSGGIHALSNVELKELSDRMNLESSYSRLIQNNSSQIAGGEKFVKDNVGRVKLGLDAVTTGQQVYKTIVDIQKATQKK